MILVTGATGLIGSHLLYRLVSGGGRVRITIRDRRRLEGIRRVFNYYNKETEAMMSKVEIIEGDLLNPLFCQEAMAGVSEVYHCAAMVSFRPSDREMLIARNTAITATVVNSCLASGVRKMIYVSSTAATGNPIQPGHIITEKSEWKLERNTTGYSISKHLSEMEVWRGEAEGLTVAIVNPAVVIGPGNWGESSTAIIEKCYQGLRFYTTGINAIVDVRDVSEVMVRLMDSDINGERYILAGANLSFRSLFELIATAFGKPAPRIRARRWMGELVWRVEWLRSKISRKAPVITRESARTAMTEHYYSSEKVQKALDFTFTPLEETIAWTCQHYLNDLEQRPV